MNPAAWAVTLAQADPGQAIQVQDSGMRVVLGLLVAAIAALATVITILWRRGERRNERHIRAGEEALAREVARTAAAVAHAEAMAERFAAEREAFAELLAAERESYAEDRDKQRVEDATQRAADRAEYGASLRAILEKQASTDAKLTEGISRVGQVLEAARTRTPRKG